MVGLFLQAPQPAKWQGYSDYYCQARFRGYADDRHLREKGLLWAQPDQIAKGIVAAVEHRRDVVYLPWFWRWIMLVILHIPERVFKKSETIVINLGLQGGLFIVLAERWSDY